MNCVVVVFFFFFFFSVLLSDFFMYLCVLCKLPSVENCIACH